jgi:hypothetical protein
MRLFALPLGALALLACGSSAPPRPVITPMTPEAEVAFENGIDFMGDPSILEGNWLEDWDRDIRDRSELSDAVLLVRVRALQQNVDLDRHQSYRILVHVDTVRFGTGVPDDMTYVSREGEPGYASVHENESRLLEQSFVAFVRWAETPEGEVVARWHLSPASSGVMRRVNDVLNRRTTTRPRTVTVHDGRDPTSGDEDRESE